MNTTMVLSTYESGNVNDEVRGYLFIDLKRHLKDSFNEYVSYITEHELDLSRKEKNKLGIHFILKKVIKICSTTSTKKWFYYQVEDETAEEYKLVKRIFGSLPTNVSYGEGDFNTFIDNRDYSSFTSIDASQASFRKFRQFLKRYELQALEKEFLSNMNIKLSLLP